MNSIDFNEVLDEQLERTKKVLSGKAVEYATDDDRLHNFKVAAHLQGTTLRQAVAGMMVKHTVSVYDMAALETEFTGEMWDEKITDHINYLILLKAALVEEALSKPQLAMASEERDVEEMDSPGYHPTRVSGQM